MKGIFLATFLFLGLPIFSQDIKEATQLLYHKRYLTAEMALHGLIKNDPGNVSAWYLLSVADVQLGKIRQITDSLNLAPGQISSAPLFNVAKGTVLLERGLADTAGIYFQKALDETKQKEPAILLAVARAEINAARGNATEAIDLLTKAIKKDKHAPELYSALGDAYRKLKDASKAYQAYQDALSEDADFAEASYMMGMIFVSQNSPEMYLKYFNDAVAADPNYAPAYYQLYFHYYFRDVKTAMDYLKKYIAVSDPDIQTDYDYTDLLYLTGQYAEAIKNATLLIKRNREVPPRIYKLIAYSFQENGNSNEAFDYMQKYFSVAPDSIRVVKDFSTMAALYFSRKQSDSAALFYKKAVALETDSAELTGYFKKIADIFSEQKNYPEQAYWMEKYCKLNTRANNVDLFNWGIARYLNGEYQKSDSVFAIYAAKYPTQDFGYYWRARSNAAIDTAMGEGLAVPYYSKLIEVAQQDTMNATNRKHLVEAYGYLAAYEANHEKNYEVSIDYFEKLLSLDPANDNAKKYIEILKTNLAKKHQTGSF